MSLPLNRFVVVWTRFHYAFIEHHPLNGRAMNAVPLAISETVFSTAKLKCLDTSLQFRDHELSDAWLLYLYAIKLRKYSEDSFGNNWLSSEGKHVPL
jgi:hypothetical protein